MFEWIRCIDASAYGLTIGKDYQLVSYSQDKKYCNIIDDNDNTSSFLVSRFVYLNKAETKPNTDEKQFTFTVSINFNETDFRKLFKDE